MGYISNGQDYTYGLKTKANMEAITGALEGETCYNTDYDRVHVYNGSFWMHEHLIEMTNNSGLTVSEGDVMILDTTQNGSMLRPTAIDQVIFGVVYEGGADASQVTLTMCGPCRINCNAAPNAGDQFVTIANSFAVTTDGVGNVGRGGCITDDSGGAGLNWALLVKREVF